MLQVVVRLSEQTCVHHEGSANLMVTSCLFTEAGNWGLNMAAAAVAV